MTDKAKTNAVEFTVLRMDFTYEIGTNLKEMLALFGTDLVFLHAARSIKNQAQSFAKRKIEAKIPQGQVQGLLYSEFKVADPSSSQKLTDQEKFRRMFKKLSHEEKYNVLKQMGLTEPVIKTMMLAEEKE